MGKAVGQQRVSELVEQVRRLRERVHDLEAAAENQTRQYAAEVRRLNEGASLDEARQLRREAELLAQRRMLVELLARIVKGVQ